MMARSAQAGFDEDLEGFDADDDFAFPPAPPSTRAADPFEDSFETPDEEPAPPARGAMAPANPVGALMAHAEAALGETPVPRITIHVFFQNAETGALAEKAAGDRRLARATVMVRQGGLAAALDLYQNQATPSLIMIESVDPAPTLLGGLDRLAEVCDPGTKVVVIGAHNDIALYRELMRRGVSEYLVPPLEPLQLIRAVTTLYADPSTPFVGRSIAFVGAKGGVGSSTLAHNVAYLLSEQMQANTVIVDYDLAFGTAGLDFNQDPIQGVADALLKPDRLDPVLLDRMTARCSDRLSLFAAPASLDDDYDISTEAYEEVSSKIRATAPYVVLDLPHVWSGWMRRTLLSADDVVIVAMPDLASLRNGKNLIDLIKKARPNDTPPQLILNQVNVPNRPEIPVKDFAKALGVEPALVLPFDAKLFGQASNNGQMIPEVNAKAKVSEGLGQFTQNLSRREAPAQKSRSLIERLVKRG
jgi:pilus assembly protein CpaE